MSLARSLCVRLVGIAFVVHTFGALADSVSPVTDSSTEAIEPIHYKLTLSNYSTPNLHANDVNLRLDHGDQRGWLGYYKEGPSGFEQWRGGYERTDQVLSVDIDTSLQVATHGFWGGSITATAGDPFFGVVGYGRTNLKPYANLNFDPNDAITLGVGWKKADGLNVTLFVVRDDRVVPGQQNMHLLIHDPLQNQQRVTLDIVHKTGPADQGQSIKGTGISVTYDWLHVFLRAAYDPKVNFTQENMTRLSVGMRF